MTWSPTYTSMVTVSWECFSSWVTKPIQYCKVKNKIIIKKKEFPEKNAYCTDHTEIGPIEWKYSIELSF